MFDVLFWLLRSKLNESGFLLLVVLLLRRFDFTKLNRFAWNTWSKEQTNCELKYWLYWSKICPEVGQTLGHIKWEKEKCIPRRGWWNKSNRAPSASPLTRALSLLNITLSLALPSPASFALLVLTLLRSLINHKYHDKSFLSSSERKFLFAWFVLYVNSFM